VWKDQSHIDRGLNVCHARSAIRLLFALASLTFASSLQKVLCKALKHGADISIHSCSKFIGGHSDVLAGVAVFKEVQHFLPVRSARLHQGSILGNLECYLLLRSLKTLSLRVKQHGKTAAKVAGFLAGQGDIIEWVRNGAIDQPKIWESFVTKAGVFPQKAARLAVACFTFCFKKEEHAQSFQRQLLLFANCTSLGGAHSSIDHRNRWDSNRDAREFRISIGLEDPQDLIADLDRAFQSLRLASHVGGSLAKSQIDPHYEC
jgi:cystathionine gamma-synthase